jgi:CcmD family protein
MAGALLGALPALPLHEAGKYVAGAYVVAFVLVLVYVAIMAVRLSHIQRELGELLAHERSAAGDAQDSAPASAPLP